MTLAADARATLLTREAASPELEGESQAELDLAWSSEAIYASPDTNAVHVVSRASRPVDLPRSSGQQSIQTRSRQINIYKVEQIIESQSSSTNAFKALSHAREYVDMGAVRDCSQSISRFSAGTRADSWPVRAPRTSPYSTSWCWTAYRMSSELFFMPIFNKIRARYVLTVLTLSARSRAISVRVFPEASMRIT